MNGYCDIAGCYRADEVNGLCDLHDRDRLQRELAIALERLEAAEADTARRCAEMAMERCRLLNGDAVAQIRAGRPEMASRTELKADQFEWIANAICREFKLDAARKEGKP